MVVQTLPSGTRTISAKLSLQISKGRSPTRLTAAPSTKLSICFKAVFSPFSIEVFIDAAPEGSTPMILVCGLNWLNTVIMPDANPPPPIGTNK